MKKILSLFLAITLAVGVLLCAPVKLPGLIVSASAEDATVPEGITNEGNGNIYPCDFYCTDEWLLGNINNTNESFETLANSEKAIKFLKDSIHITEECKQCKYFALCRSGGCKRSREDRNYCESYKAFFDACLPLFRAFIAEKK